MADAARKNRRRKNEVVTIDDDDSTDQKPKIGKKDEESSILSREVVELREKLRETEEKLLKSEDKFQRLCRIAREHELRAERAEGLLDSKRGVLEAMNNEELEKKVISLTNQMEEERKVGVERETTIVELREKLGETEEKLLKSEDNFQRLCRIAREHELRAERAEGLLDSKRDVLDATKNEELEKKIFSLTNQLEEDRKVTSEKMAELSRKLAEERSRSMRWVERESNMSNQLDAERRSLAEYRTRENNILNQLEAERRSLAEYRTRMADQLAEEKSRSMRWAQRENNILNQLEAERRSLAEYRTRNDELTSRLAMFDAWAVQLQQPLPPMHQYQNWITASSAAFAPQPVERPAKIYETGHPTNILQMLRAGTPKSVGLDSAVGQLRAKWIECGEEQWKRAMMGDGVEELLECSVCEKTVPKGEVLAHFLSQLHIQRVRAHGAAVSLAAYQHWFRLLQQAAAVVPEAAAAAYAPSEAN